MNAKLNRETCAPRRANGTLRGKIKKERNKRERKRERVQERERERWWGETEDGRGDVRGGNGEKTGEREREREDGEKATGSFASLSLDRYRFRRRNYREP